MTDINQSDENTGGLPELDQPAVKRTKKKPPLAFVVVVVSLLVAAGVGVQYAIEHMDLFGTKPVKVEEPPEPVVIDGAVASEQVPVSIDNPQSYSIAGVDDAFPDSDSGPASGRTPQPVLPSELTQINESLELIAAEIGGISAEMSKQRQVLADLARQQSALSVQVNMEATQRLEWDEKLVAGIKQNERWLGGISNQLKDIGVEVKEAAQDFPVVVYSRNIWGDDVYLTVASKANPDQTSFLRVGGIVGRWRLIDIENDRAIFEHFDGNRKEVML